MDTNLVTTIFFGVISTILAIITIMQGRKNKQLDDKRQQVHNTAQTIIQNNNFYALPEEIKEQIKFISVNTANNISVEKVEISSLDTGTKKKE